MYVCLLNSYVYLKSGQFYQQLTHWEAARLRAPIVEKRLPKGPWCPQWLVLSETNICVVKPLFQGPKSAKRLAKGYWLSPPANRLTGLFYPRLVSLGLSGPLWAYLGLSGP